MKMKQTIKHFDVTMKGLGSIVNKDGKSSLKDSRKGDKVTQEGYHNDPIVVALIYLF
jgi:hypothetical protein